MKTKTVQAALVALLTCGAAGAGVNSFTHAGPEGGITRSIAVNPADSSLLVISTARGIYRSTNGGQSWDYVPTLFYNDVQDLQFDPTNSNRVVGYSGQIYLSEDGGQTFAFAQNPTEQNQVSRMVYASDGTLYAGLYGGRLFKSSGSLTTWTELATGWSTTTSPSTIGAMAVDPAHPATIYVGLDTGGLFRSTNGGATWQGPLAGGPIPPTATYVSRMAVDPNNANRVLAATTAGIYVSTNGGTSWSVASPGGPAVWIGFDPTAANHVTAILPYGTVLRSIDGGATWPQTGAELRLAMPALATFDARNAGRLWLATVNGPARSTDNGDTFSYLNSGIHAGGPWKFNSSDDGTIHFAMNAGLAGIFRRSDDYAALDIAALRNATSGPFSINALAVAAGNSKLIYAVSNWSQLVRSSDGGVTWSAPHPQFTTGDSTAEVTIDPSNNNIAYVSRASTGVWKTINGGSTWTQQLGSPRMAGVLRVDPANSAVLYLAGGDGSLSTIYKSVNGGTTWVPKLDTQMQHWFNDFVFDPVDSRIIYATGGGVHKTTDGGDHWSLINFSPLTGTTAGATAFLIDPAIPTTMVMVGTSSTGGFTRTVDGGATWDETGAELPGKDAILYGGGFAQGRADMLVLGTLGAGVLEYQIAPDLQISLAGATQPMPLGSSTSVTATVRNLGPHAVSAAQVHITVPSWMTPAPPSNCAFAAPTLTCQLDFIRVNLLKTITVPLTVSATPSQGNLVAVVEGHERDPVPGNDTATLPMQSTEQADLGVTFTGGATTLDNRAAITVPVEVRNAGPNASTNTQLVFQLGTALVNATATASQGTCTTTGTAATCALGTINVGTVVSAQLNATTAVAGAAAVTVTADGAGTDTGTDQGITRNLTIRAVGDAAVTLTDSLDPVTAGTTWSYTATVRNNGPDTGAGTLSVVFAGATPGAITAGGSTCVLAGGTATCTMSPLASGASTTVTLNASQPFAGTASATATIAFDGTDPSTANNTATESTTVAAAPGSGSSSSGGGKGGGGGRFDWLALVLLGGLVAGRCRAGKPG